MTTPEPLSPEGLFRRRCRVAGAGLVLLAVPAAWALARWPEAHGASAVLHDAVTGRGGLWRAMRGVLAFLAIPAAIVVAALLVWLESRRSRRDAVVLGAFIVGSNVLVQAVKHPGLTEPPWASIDPVSGHVGVLGAVALGAVIVAPGRWQRAVAGAAALVVAATGLGVILAGWHTLPQVLCPLLIVSGCALVTATLVDRPTREAAEHAPSERRHVRFGAVVGLGLSAGALVVASAVSPNLRTMVLTTTVLLVVISLAAVTALLFAALTPAGRTALAST